jgi:hypothetical protein
MEDPNPANTNIPATTQRILPPLRNSGKLASNELFKVVEEIFPTCLSQTRNEEYKEETRTFSSHSGDNAALNSYNPRKAS